MNTFNWLLIVAFHARLTVNERLPSSAPMPVFIAPTATGNQTKPRLTAMIITHYSGTVGPAGPLSTSVMQIAIDAIAKANILPSYEFAIQLFDDKPNLGLRLFIDAMEDKNQTNNNRVPLSIGPVCSGQQYVASVLKFYNLVGVAAGSTVAGIYNDRKRYSNMFVSSPAWGTMYAAVPHFIEMNSWRNIYLLSEGTDYFDQNDKILQYNLAKLNISLTGVSKIVYSITDGLPNSGQIQEAVAEMKKYDPRIIILSTNYAPLVACWLHRYGLFGPNYVFLAVTISDYLPNTPLRFRPWCTDQMLADILQSLILFDYARTVNLGNGNATDSLGLTVSYFEKALRDMLLDRPEDSRFYWTTRSLFYDQVVAAALALNATEAELQKRNDTLTNWVIGSDKFESNADFIDSLLKKSLSELSYDGLGMSVRASMNSKQGATAFYQVQMVNVPKSPEDYMSSFIKVFVAIFDESKPDSKIQKSVVASLKWRTEDGQPPYDSLRIIQFNDDIVSTPTRAALLSVSSALVLANMILLGLSVFHGNFVANPTSRLNKIILIGNSLLAFFIFIAPFQSQATVNLNCSFSSLVLVLGFSFLITGLLAKMEIGNMMNVVTVQSTQGTTSGQTAKQGRGNNSRVRTIRTLDKIALTRIKNRRTAVSLTNKSLSRKSPCSNTGANFVQDPVNVVVATDYALKSSVVASVVLTLFVAIWLAVSPINVVKSVGKSERIKSGANIAYEPYSFVCALSADNTKNSAFFGTLLAILGVVFLRLLFLAFMLRKKIAVISRTDGPDLALARMASYGVVIVTIAGCGVMAAFFRESPVSIMITISVLVISINCITLTTTFGFKVRKSLGQRNDLPVNIS